MSEDGRGLFLVETSSVGMTVIEAADGGAELRVELPVIGRLSEWDSIVKSRHNADIMPSSFQPDLTGESFRPSREPITHVVDIGKGPEGSSLLT